MANQEYKMSDSQEGFAAPGGCDCECCDPQTGECKCGPDCPCEKTGCNC